MVFERTSGTAAAPPQGAVIRFKNSPDGPKTLSFPEFTGTAYDFVEVAGPGGAEVCTSGNMQGCSQSNGVWVYAENRTYAAAIPASLNNGTNSTGEYHLTSEGGGAGGSLGNVNNNSYELRMSGESIVYHLFTDTPNHPGYVVPFEFWDIGTTPADASDDVKLIPILFADAATDDSDVCDGFKYEFESTRTDNLLTKRIYAYYPTTTYAAWEAAAKPLIFPFQSNTVLTINTSEFAALRGNAEAELTALDDISVVPNPYRGSSLYEADANDRQVRFVNLPSSATIRIFTISGTLVREIVKPASTTTVAFWDLENQRGLPVASGMYLVHIEARNPSGSVIGERVLKLGVVQRRPNIDIL